MVVWPGVFVGFDPFFVITTSFTIHRDTPGLIREAGVTTYQAWKLALLEDMIDPWRNRHRTPDEDIPGIRP